MKNKMNKEYKIFGGRKIRRVLHNDNWYFSVVDVVEVLSESPTPRQYWGKIKIREFEEIQLSPIWVQLKLRAEDGKMRETDCADTESIFRIIQSIPSKKAEPFKRWLAKVGSERIQEIENPELAQNRARGYYEVKGYPKDWIDKRIRGIAVRQDLTKEWSERGVEEGQEYAILTNEISEATFGIPIKEHKEIKELNSELKNENLRDHMTDLELIFSMLGEKVTTEITKEEDLTGFEECLNAGIRGGNVAGKARRDAEEEIGKNVVSDRNARDLVKKKEKKKEKKKKVEEKILVEVKNE